MTRVPFRSVDGLLLLDKSKNVTSNRALQDARFCFKAKKAGHTGTLDPFATGLLPVCFGQANKYCRWLLDADKTYKFKAVLGQHSTTGDTEGVITKEDSPPTITSDQLHRIEKQFTGCIQQIPPKYSAIKIDGRRAYDRARKGEEFTIPTREVTIHSLQLEISDNQLIGSVCVSKGTYIRTLVEDMAIALGTRAYCKELRRTQVGQLLNDNNDNDQSSRRMYSIEQLKSIDEAEQDSYLLPMDRLCQQFPIQPINYAHWEMLIRGKHTTIDSEYVGIVRIYLDGTFYGLAKIEQNRLKAFRLIDTGFH